MERDDVVATEVSVGGWPRRDDIIAAEDSVGGWPRRRRAGGRER